MPTYITAISFIINYVDWVTIKWGYKAESYSFNPNSTPPPIATIHQLAIRTIWINISGNKYLWAMERMFPFRSAYLFVKQLFQANTDPHNKWYDCVCPQIHEILNTVLCIWCVLSCHASWHLMFLFGFVNDNALLPILTCSLSVPLSVGAL